MKRLASAAAALALAASGLAAAVVPASASAAAGWTGLRAGVAVVDATWHVGAGAGQYASTEDPTDLSEEWDPNLQHVKDAPSYGVADRLDIRALVLQDGKGDAPVALVKVDNYLAQDDLTERVAQILQADGSKVTYGNILMSATHDHNSPYYSTPAAGVWLFQDVMDLRMFEYQARAMAAAIEHAEASMVPARLGGTTVQDPDFQGNIAGADQNEDGSPTGYPLWDNDHGLVVLRIDDMSDPSAPKPLATYVNYAEHGESLDGYDLISEDWLAPFQHYVDEGTGSTVVFSQGSVGSAEGPYDYSPARQATDGGEEFPEVYGHEGYAQRDRGTHLLAERVISAWQAIGGAHNGVDVQVPFQADPTVTMLTHWVAGPLSHPYPSVGNCRTAPTGDGNPGVPAAGLPDCERLADNDGGYTLPFTADLYNALVSAGAPIPANYDVPSTQAVEENLRIKLQAVRLGDILLASCSCEPQSDLIKNLESRTDSVVGNMFYGFDYADQADVDEGWPDDGNPVDHRVRACYPVDPATVSCPDPRDRYGVRRDTVSTAAFQHMEAEITNDANGWNDPSYVAQAESEPTDVSQIKGNFTHSELGADEDGLDYSRCPGYAMSVGLGHTGDYDGYTVTYREYMARDAYRKALTAYGPHSADYYVTNLVGMAAALEGCGSVLAQPTDPIATADDARQTAEATVLGTISSAYYDAWTAQVPDSSVPADQVLAQPWSISRFDVTQFRWVGGDNWTDDPTVRVQRLVGRTWTDYAEQDGGVQVFLDTPPDLVTGATTYRSSSQEWDWRASFEAYDAYPRADVPGGQTPTGTYRFVVDGHVHTGGAVQPYHLVSAPFAVTPWTGITTSAVTRDSATQASFTVAPITYPRTPPAAHTAGIRWYADDSGATPGHGSVCKTCSFNPWARTGQVATAAVQVTLPDGSTQRVPASYDASTGRWVATVPADATAVTVPDGAVRDAYGESNGPLPDDGVGTDLPEAPWAPALLVAGVAVAVGAATLARRRHRRHLAA